MPHVPRNVQSPYTAQDFWDRWNSVNPRMALFVKVTPRSIYAKPTIDPVGFTTNTRDMTLPSHIITFRSAAGMIPSEMGQSFGETAVMEFQGMYATGIFTAEDVVAGVWNDAKVEIFASPWDDVNLGELVMFTGNLAEFEHYGDYFKAEIRGLSARLSQDTGSVTSRNCRVKFKSTACGYTGTTITIDSVTYNLSVSGTIRSNASTEEVYSRTFLSIATSPWITPTYPNGFFKNGTVTINGIVREIADSFGYAEGGDPAPIAPLVVQLKRPLPFTPEFGDAITIARGCNKRVEDCRAYNNIANFRGEPYVPGLETINRVPPPTTEII